MSNTQSSASEEVNEYLRQQNQLDLLRFITCGSVDDGKSTLIGRMLYEAQLVFEDQVAALLKDSKSRALRAATLILRCWLTDWPPSGAGYYHRRRLPFLRD